MENLIKHVAKQSLTQEFFQDLATSFSCAPIRAGKPDVTWEQVQSWFQDKQKELQAKSTSSANTFELLVDFSDSNVSRIPPQVSQKPKGKWVTELSELAFEAKSSKDDAWYDVATFLSYRVVSSGDLEVKVRFSGFGREEDEWVNVRGAVRERSIPLEASECPKVKVGDLVLCFQEREHQAVYCDAEVVVIHRGLHDMNGACKCTFVVRFDHDSSEVNFQGSMCRYVCIQVQFIALTVPDWIDVLINNIRNMLIWGGYVSGLHKALQQILKPNRSSFEIGT
ncbi:hypothetical protein C1H46_018931 [Malus baccata]|uniref:SAWADEE domain-containing protein n=1 Tax=Malus baccata TaxID=106549 RepID=A0A540M9R5_MALBA|nr:hypothetical protein C1H46_018931 [Malus baccata]